MCQVGVPSVQAAWGLLCRQCSHSSDGHLWADTEPCLCLRHLTGKCHHVPLALVSGGVAHAPHGAVQEDLRCRHEECTGRLQLVRHLDDETCGALQRLSQVGGLNLPNGEHQSL